MWPAKSVLTWSKLVNRTKVAKRLNLRGPKLWFLFIEGQNRNFLKVKGEKCTLAKNLHKKSEVDSFGQKEVLLDTGPAITTMLK